MKRNIGIVILVIIGILTLTAVTANYNRSRERSKTLACLASMKKIRSAGAEFSAVNKTGGAYNLNLNKDLVEKGFMNSNPQCPSAGTYRIAITAGSGKNNINVFCSTHGEINDISEPGLYEKATDKLRNFFVGDEGVDYISWALVAVVIWIVYICCFRR